MNTQQALSVASCAIHAQLFGQPIKLDKADLTQAAVILAQIGATLRPATEQEPSTLLADLTKREIQVLEWIAAGHTNEQTAKGLCVSVNTVKAHTRHIIEKLNCDNRAQVIALAGAAGLGG